jgi:hypothetical protein
MTVSSVEINNCIAAGSVPEDGHALPVTPQLG